MSDHQLLLLESALDTLMLVVSYVMVAAAFFDVMYILLRKNYLYIFPVIFTTSIAVVSILIFGRPYTRYTGDVLSLLSLPVSVYGSFCLTKWLMYWLKIKKNFALIQVLLPLFFMGLLFISGMVSLGIAYECDSRKCQIER